jgi:putative transcriptional regulator
MNCTELQELAALKAVGALDREAAIRLDALLVDDSDAAAEARTLLESATAFACATTTPRNPPTQIRAALLEKIKGRKRTAPTPMAPAAVPQGFSFIKASDEGWMDSPIPGIRFKLLSINAKEGYRVVMADLAPGARFPRHVHRTGPEDLMVLSGDLVTEGHHLRAGDHLHAEGGTDHGELWSPEGCRALVIEPIEGPEIAMAGVEG